MEQAMTSQSHRYTLTLPNDVQVSAPESLVARALLDLIPSPIDDHSHLRDALAAADRLRPPALGHYWQGQGGIYAGTIRGEDGAPDYHLIVAVGPEGEIESTTWGPRGKHIEGAQHDRDGLLNTRAMADAGSDLAKKFLALEHDGHNDWYLPAKQELALCWMNTQDVFAKSWHWSSTQYSAGSAFVQYFYDGGQGYAGKDTLYRARAVRRLVIQ